jgi:hypothetical protein
LDTCHARWHLVHPAQCELSHVSPHQHKGKIEIDQPRQADYLGRVNHNLNLLLANALLLRSAAVGF